MVLDRQLAARGHFPAIDVLQSVSRVMPAVVAPGHLGLAARARQLLATWERQRDMVALGAYVRGTDAATEEAIARIGAVESLLQQPPREPSTLEDAVRALEAALA